MVQQLSMQTDRQSLVFFPHQAVTHLHLYESFSAAEQARSLAIGESIGRLYNAIAGAVSAYFERQSVRQELYAMDDRLLDDIGLTRGDIEAVVAGYKPEAEVVVEPVVDMPEEAPVAKPVLVEAILRRAA